MFSRSRVDLASLSSLQTTSVSPALREAGCAKVFAEKQSGAKTDRAQLAKAIATLTAVLAVRQASGHLLIPVRSR